MDMIKQWLTGIIKAVISEEVGTSKEDIQRMITEEVQATIEPIEEKINKVLDNIDGISDNVVESAKKEVRDLEAKIPSVEKIESMVKNLIG